jgi:hypothetical protein
LLRGRGASRVQLLGFGPRCAQNAPKDGARLHSVRAQGGPFIKFRGGEFSTGTMRNFQPELTALARFVASPGQRVTGRQDPSRQLQGLRDLQHGARCGSFQDHYGNYPIDGTVQIDDYVVYRRFQRGGIYCRHICSHHCRCG